MFRRGCNNHAPFHASPKAICRRPGRRYGAILASNLQASAAFRGLSSNLLGIAAAAYLLAAPALADDSTFLSFNKNCIGCHVGGGNVVQAGATLRAGDLQRNGVASAEAIYDLVYSGRGKMPGYGTGCTPKGKCTFGPRLSDEEIQRLSQYIVEQAAADWK